VRPAALLTVVSASAWPVPPVANATDAAETLPTPTLRAVESAKPPKDMASACDSTLPPDPVDVAVDSAVALVRAAPNAIGVTLRLWLDPHGPSSERACCSPDAVIAAREKIVLGAVSMVQMALDELARKDVVKLDEERKAAMVSNLLVVLCGSGEAAPVINTGTLYT